MATVLGENWASQATVVLSALNAWAVGKAQFSAGPLAPSASWSKQVPVIPFAADGSATGEAQCSAGLPAA